MSRATSESSTLRLSWKAVAWVSWTLFAALSVGLIVVASLRDVDVLSLVALCLAVLAFIIQILVFVVQTFASNQQLLRAEELNGATARMLAKIEEKAEGTRAAVARLDDRFLAAVLGSAERAASEKGLRFDPQVVTQAFEEAAEQVNMTGETYNLHDALSWDTSPRWTSLGYSLEKPSQEEMPTIMGILEDLEAPLLDALWDLGTDLRRYGPTQPGSERPAHGLPALNGEERLTSLGLVKREAASWIDGVEVLILTKLGEKVASALIERWTPSDRATASRLQRIRSSTVDYRWATNSAE